MRFLLSLSQNVTVPKIINITDNLLANNAQVKCGTLALIELAYNFYFKDVVADTNSMTEVHNKVEMITQKEVAFSMLMKFMEDVQVRLFLFL